MFKPRDFLIIFSLLAAAAIVAVVNGNFKKQSAVILDAINTPSQEQAGSATETPYVYTADDCENFSEAKTFDKPIPVEWTAKLDGCLISCLGASFTKVSPDDKYTHFAAYYRGNADAIADEFLEDGLTLKVTGMWTGIGSDHPRSVFENQCVPSVDIEKIEIVN